MNKIIQENQMKLLIEHHRPSKTQLLRDLLNQEADSIGGAEVLYPEV